MAIGRSWHRFAVEDLISGGVLYIGDGYRAKREELSSNGVPFARAGDIDAGFKFDSADHFPVEDIGKVGGKVSCTGDVVFTSKGTVGRFAYVEENIGPFVYSPQLSFWRVLNSKVIASRFLYYWMQGPEFRYQFYGVKGQTDMADYVSLRDQRRMQMTVPPLPEQRAIAHILGSLDDKIELNRQMNRTLEAMARAIFKSWFVDFDPVWAKAEGRAPAGMDTATAALFPDRFVESELGPIPAGWEVKPLAVILEIISGGTPRTTVAEYWDGQIPWFSVKDAPSDGDVFVIETEKKVTEAGIENSAAKVMRAGTTIISARGTVGKLALVDRPMAMNQSCYGLQGQENYGDFYTYFLIQATVAELQQNTHGSVFDTITRRTFETISICLPPVPIAQAFESLMTPMLERIKSNLHESRTLAELRDTLLPKLISGELRVPVTGGGR